MNPLRVFLFICLILVCSCKKQAQPPPLPEKVDPLLLKGTNALERVVEFVGLGPRVSGTEGAEKAAAYLERKLQEIGIEATVDEFEDVSGEKTVTFRNVIGHIPRDGDGLIVLGSHYDLWSGGGSAFKGANDSGSSTGLLLEIASILKRSRQGPSILIAFFDGEECVKQYGPHDGLHGSRRLAGQLIKDGRAERVLAVLILDMVGDRNLTITLPRNSSSELLAAVFDAAREEGVRSNFSLHAGAIVDDHEPFLKAGMRAADVIDYEYGSAPGKNDYWHTPEDTVDKLSAQSLEMVGRVVIRLINSPALAPARPTLR